MPTPWGDFTCYVYESLLDGEQHVAFVKGAGGEDDTDLGGAAGCLQVGDPGREVEHRRDLAEGLEGE